MRVFLEADNAKEIYEIVEDFTSRGGYIYDYNGDLLRFSGISGNDGFNRVLFSLAAILIVLIMVGTISLIYNSFAISVSERKKQFGLLSGAGATAKQRMNSVFFKALVIAGIGIPVGVASGVVGIGVTLHLLRNVIVSLIHNFGKIPLTLHGVSMSFYLPVHSFLLAIFCVFLIVFVSMMYSMRKIRRENVLDALKNENL